MNMAPNPFCRHLVGIALALLLGAPSIAFGQAAPSLGQADSFAVLGGSAITNTGATVVTGDLGIWPGTASSISGFPPGMVNGTTHAGDAVAMQAQSDLTTAYNDLAGRACNTDLTGTDLGGLTLTPGVYCFSTSAQLTGTLTLDALGNPDAIFIFQIGSTLTTASNARVVLANGGSNCGVYWQVGSSVTLGTGSRVAGNVLALSSITVTTGSSLSGRALARNGAVTLDTDRVTVCTGCPNISLTPATLPNGVLATAYSQTVVASGGTSPYAYSLLAGALPPGLLLNGVTGAISGTPTQAGSFNFSVGASDSASCPGSRIYNIIINAPQCPLITLLPATLPAPQVGTAYSQTVNASGGQTPYVYAVSTGALPAGLLLDPNSGVISGTPSAAGSYSFTITATDANGCFAARTYSGQVNPMMCPLISVTPPTLPVMVLGQPYSQTIRGNGGTAPYGYVVTSGALPTGISLNAQTGVLSGVSQTLGNVEFVVTVTDALGCSMNISYQAMTAAGAVPMLIPTLSMPALLVLLGAIGIFAVFFSAALRRT